MTLFRIEHAVVMDTDDIPGRGGYSLVGISSGVKQAERSFVAGNFGISDYLHDPKTEKRIVYSSFRIPGGRHALVRRFARGVRRNQTQSRLYVHTLFMDDDVFQRLHGLPWLLVNARVRPEGSPEWERLRDDVPWSFDGTSLPALEWDDADGVTNDIVSRLNARLTSIGNQLPQLPGGASSPSDLVARVLGALSNHPRVLLPQGSAHELVTMLAWSMLPLRDREEIAWTQHDAANISGVDFQLANSAMAEPYLTNLQDEAAPFASWVVQANTASEESWRNFHERSQRLGLTVRKGDDIAAWQRWGDALHDLHERLGGPEPALATALQALAKAGETRAEAPWIDSQEVLQLVWNQVSQRISRGEPALVAVNHWGKQLYLSGLDKVILRVAPSRAWLDEAAARAGSDAVVWFFLYATESNPESQAARSAVAEWIVAGDRKDIEPATLARLAFPLAFDRSAALGPLLERALATEGGLTTFRETVGVRRDVTELVFRALPIVLMNGHPGTVTFLRDVFVPRARPNMKPDLTRAVGSALREDPEAFFQFQARLSPEGGAELIEQVTKWMFSEPERTLPLAREVFRRVKGDRSATEVAGKLAIAMASAREPAAVWFDVLLQMARRTDANNETLATNNFLETVDRLSARSPNLEGAVEPLLLVLQNDLRVGKCVRALVLFTRPVWRSRVRDLAEALAALVSQATLASVWEEIVVAFAVDFGGDRVRARDFAPLVSAFWLRVDPSQIPDLDPRTVDAIRVAGDGVRKKLAEHWSKPARLPNIPPSPTSDRLLALLFDERVVGASDVRSALRGRELEQGIATFATLNQLDRALRDRRDVAEMSSALEKFLGARSADVRLLTLLRLLAADEVQPTVKVTATQHVLPGLLEGLGKRQWTAFVASATEEELLGCGAAALAVARRAGAVASRSTIEALERIYDGRQRADAAEALDDGWATRGPLKSLARLFGSDDMRIVDGRPVSM